MPSHPQLFFLVVSDSWCFHICIYIHIVNKAMLTMNLISATWVNDNRLFSCSVSTVNPLCCFVTVKKILKKWLPRSGHLGVISSGFAFAFSVRANHIIDLDEDRNLLFQVMLSRWTGVGEWNLQTTKNHPERDFRNMPRGLRCHYRWRPSQSLSVFQARCLLSPPSCCLYEYLWKCHKDTKSSEELSIMRKG